jgi:hypothetical protein
VLSFTRVGLPVTMALAGLAAIILGHGTTSLAAAGVVLMGAGLMVWMLNVAFRLSVQSNKDRDREEAARDYFAEHGRWPDE